MRSLTRFFLRRYARADGVQQCWTATRIYLHGFKRRSPRFTSDEPQVTFP
jgi:hypothetical protein